MAIRGILYDNDGTLVDTHDLILSSMRYTMETVLGKQLPDEELLRGVGTPLDDQLLELAQGDEGLGAELARVYRAHNEARHDAAVKLFDGVAEGLRVLSDAGFRMGVVTAKRHALAQRGLEITGAWQYLDCLVGADDCPRAKPDPDPIVMAADVLGLESRECLYVGDSPFDMQAGNAAGSISVAALWGMFPREVLAAENPAHECASFSELVEYAFKL